MHPLPGGHHSPSPSPPPSLILSLTLILSLSHPHPLSLPLSPLAGGGVEQQQDLSGPPLGVDAQHLRLEHVLGALSGVRGQGFRGQ